MSIMFLHILYLTAITAEAMTAALAAGRRSMDWVGVCLLGCVTALGGGSVRDLLLGRYPLVWVEHPSYLLVTARHHRDRPAHAPPAHAVPRARCNRPGRLHGHRLQHRAGTGPAVVIVAGMITGCVGGVPGQMSHG